MCARHGRGVIEICLSEKGVQAKKRFGNTGVHDSVITPPKNQNTHQDKLSLTPDCSRLEPYNYCLP